MMLIKQNPLIIYLVESDVAGLGRDLLDVVVDKDGVEGSPLPRPPDDVERRPGHRLLSSRVPPVLVLLRLVHPRKGGGGHEQGSGPAFRQPLSDKINFSLVI